MATFNERIKKISLDSIIDVFPNYFQTARRVFKHPFQLPEKVDLDIKDNNQLWRAIAFLNFGIILDFVLLIPLLMIHEEKVSKLVFLIRTFGLYFLFGVLLHFSLTVVGSRRAKLIATNTVYFYLGGFLSPLAILFFYPYLIIIGPAALTIFGKGNLDINTNLSALLVVALALQIVFTIASLIVSISWFSQSHRISKTQVFLALIMSGFIGRWVLLIINPILDALFVYVEKFLSHI